jgi:hypothetical protein
VGSETRIIIYNIICSKQMQISEVIKRISKAMIQYYIYINIIIIFVVVDKILIFRRYYKVKEGHPIQHYTRKEKIP